MKLISTQKNSFGNFMKKSIKNAIVCILLAALMTLAATSCFLFDGEKKEKIVTVTFVDFYGNVISTQEVEVGTAAIEPELDKKIGVWYFDGWDKDFSDVREEMTVRAIYKNMGYTVKYDTQGLFDVPDEACERTDIPAIPEFTVPEGYIFGGWFLDSSYKSRYDFGYPLAKDTTLYAKLYSNIDGEYTVISSASDLAAVYADPAGKYVVVNDIDFRGEYITSIPEFNGEIYGNGYKLYDFFLTDTEAIFGIIGTNNGIVDGLCFSEFEISIRRENTGDNKYYGIICGKNTGTISNCHILDGNFKVVESTALPQHQTRYTCVGAVAGYNEGTLDNCGNAVNLDISTSIAMVSVDSNSMRGYSYIGGICGHNTAIVRQCKSIGNIDVNSYNGSNTFYWSTSSPYYQLKGTYLGGLCGHNSVDGVITESVSSSSIVHEYGCAQSEEKQDYRIAGFVGYNAGTVNNCYADGSVNQTGSGKAESFLAGFVALNNGMINSCYTTVGITDSAEKINAVGGFVGYNELASGYTASITKCFATGNISVSASCDNAGYFVGQSTGSELHAYYLDSMTYKVNDETGATTLENGTAKKESELKSVGFIENTIYFDSDIWNIVDESYPTLKCFD